MSTERLLEQCDVIRQRRSGPGGQHRNKVETAIRLTHRPSGTTAEANERRSQAANLAAAVRRLRVNLAIELRQPTGDEPSDLWQTRCRQRRIHVNPSHDDFPSLLAEALDELAAADWNLRLAADRLGCNSSQVVKLLKKEPQALKLLNDHRRADGHSELR